MGGVTPCDGERRASRRVNRGGSCREELLISESCLFLSFRGGGNDDVATFVSAMAEPLLHDRSQRPCLFRQERPGAGRVPGGRPVSQEEGEASVSCRLTKNGISVVRIEGAQWMIWTRAMLPPLENEQPLLTGHVVLAVGVDGGDRPTGGRAAPAGWLRPASHDTADGAFGPFRARAYPLNAAWR